MIMICKMILQEGNTVSLIRPSTKNLRGCSGMNLGFMLLSSVVQKYRE